MLLPILVATLVPQRPTPASPGHEAVTAKLAPNTEGQGGPRWSPKGATVPLSASEQGLTGSFALGLPDAPRIAVRLQKSPGAEHYDQLWLDANRDGALAESERLVAVPKEQRGKWWSSFTAEVAVPVPAQGGAEPTTRPYPLNAWYVEDPLEPAAKPALRWSRSGWHEGRALIGGQPAFVLVTEMEMDGVFDQRDAWALARDQTGLFAAPVRSLEQHCWLDGVAWRPTAIDPHGRSLSFERFDPGTTEAEEKEKADIHKADREAPRAEKPLAFGGDLAAALASAKKAQKRVFVDFQTTWCVPCKQMDEHVYGAAAVVQAGASVVAVKLDGDEQRELVKRYAVTAYPTMLLLDGDGKELRRAVGYRSVAEMVEFLKP